MWHVQYNFSLQYKKYTETLLAVERDTIVIITLRKIQKTDL